MNITLVHSFWKNYPDANSLYKNNPKITGWISRVKKIADDITNGKPVNFKSEKITLEDIANDFRGSAFEAFGEVFIKLMGLNPLIGIDEYEPTPENDCGIDGKGIGKNGKLLTVQFKFRGEYDTVLFGDKDHLHNFVNASLELGVDTNDNNNMVILTTADEVFYKDVNVEWQNKVRYIAPNKSWGCFKGCKYTPQNPTNIFCFKSLLDNNILFWNNALKNIERGS